jgi:hypothetical protein
LGKNRIECPHFLSLFRVRKQKHNDTEMKNLDVGFSNNQRRKNGGFVRSSKSLIFASTTLLLMGFFVSSLLPIVVVGETSDLMMSAANNNKPSLPPTPIFIPPSGSFANPLVVRIDGTVRSETSAAECEKILVTIDGRAEENNNNNNNNNKIGGGGEEGNVRTIVLEREGVHVVKALCTSGTLFGEQNQATYVIGEGDGGASMMGENSLIDSGNVAEDATNNNSAKRIAGVIFLGIFLIIGMLATVGVCGAAFQSFRGEFGRGAQRFVGPGVGNARRSRLVGVGSNSAADFVNWFERNRERAVASGSRLLNDLEMSSSGVDLPRTGSNNAGAASVSSDANEAFTLDDPDEANKRD